eukprot:9157020-Prorocentrum_lima.AAC.1
MTLLVASRMPQRGLAGTSSLALSAALPSRLPASPSSSRGMAPQLLPPLGTLSGCSTGAKSSRGSPWTTSSGTPMGSSTPLI